MKKTMQDVIPQGKRTIRRIPIERVKRTNSAPIEEPEENEFVEEEETRDPHLPPEPPRLKRERTMRKFWIWIVGAVVVLILLFIILSTVFSGASLDVTPRQESVVIDGQFRATKQPGIGEVGFDVMTITRTGTREVEATGEKQVDTKASGQIVIFNDFDGKTQRLIKNTRFETPGGLIYRIPESVDVPGRHENESGELVPGSVEVTVFADTSGEKYNIGLVDFTIPGFEGDPRFFKFFARSKTPMTGGFSGVQKTVSSTDEASARSEIQIDLEGELQMAADSEIPEGMVTYRDGTFITFTERPNAPTEKEGRVEVVEEGTLQAIIIPEEELAKLIAENTVAAYDGSDVSFISPQKLSFELVDKKTLTPSLLEGFSFVLSGSGIVVWEFDDTRLREDLAGKHRSDVDTVLSGYPSIKTAEISLRPFWRRSFPENTDSITIEEQIEAPNE